MAQWRERSPPINARGLGSYEDLASCCFSPRSEGLSPHAPVFLPPEKPMFQNRRSAWKPVRAHLASFLNPSSLSLNKCYKDSQTMIEV